MTRVYLSAPHMGGLEQEFVADSFRTNWLSSVGPNLDGFEKEFEERIGLPSVALTSGTAALHLALRLIGVGPGDDVLCPTLTFVAYVGYYQHPRVVAALGLEHRPPHPKGHEMEASDLTLLDPVRRRGKLYREV